MVKVASSWSVMGSVVALLCHLSNTNKRKSYGGGNPLCHIEAMKRESTFNFRLPQSLKARLDTFCTTRGITKADLCVTALAEFLDSIEKLDRANLISRVYPPVNIEAVRTAENPTQNKPGRSAGA